MVDTPQTKLTKDELSVLQHTLGLNQHGRRKQDRNHFVGDSPVLRKLAADGLMEVHPHSGSELSGGSPAYFATVEGRLAAIDQSPAPPKLTRSQKRYRRFLASDIGISFGEWLKTEGLNG